ncbi:MAG: peptidylprolyl isomerase [Crocinitomicaceae bacterium]|nr:peptidylprolyl isomerase [Crocinitomicaceae bacterium]
MAIIGKIRDNSALVVAVIGLGLFAFLFMDMKSCGGAPQQNMELGSYKKQNPSLFSSKREKVDQKAYQKAMVTFRQNVESQVGQEFQQEKISNEQSLGRELSSEEFAALRDKYITKLQDQVKNIDAQVWAFVLDSTIVSQEYDALSLVVDNKKELMSYLTATNGFPVLAEFKQKGSQFLDSLGNIDTTKVRSSVKAMSKAKKPEEKKRWEQTKTYYSKNLLREKYFNILKQGMYVTNLEAENEYLSQNNKKSISYVFNSYNDFKPNEIKASESEVKAYFEKHKSDPIYKNEERTRSLLYFPIPIIPSKEDSSRVEASLNELVADFSKGKNDSSFVSKHHNQKFYFPRIVALREGNPKLQEIQQKQYPSLSYPFSKDNDFSLADSGKVINAFVSNGQMHIAKINGTTPSSFEARHIFINTKDVTDSVLLIKKSLRDSLFSLATSENFDDLIKKHHDTLIGDNGKIKQFDRSMLIFQKLAKHIDVANISVIDTVQSNYGYHIVEVLKRSEESYPLVSLISKDLKTSDETKRKIKEDAYQLIEKIDTKTSAINEPYKKRIKFDTLVMKQRYSPMPLEINYNRPEEGSVMNFSSKVKNELIKFAFQKEIKEGTIIGAPIDNNTDFMVVFLYSLNKKDEPTIQGHYNTAREELIKEKKFNATVKKIAKAKSLKAIASNLGKEVKTGEVNFAQNQVGKESLPDPEVVGNIFSMAKDGEQSKPIKGKNGVYVVRIDSTQKASAAKDYNKEKEILLNKKEQQVQNEAMQALVKKADIIDNRILNQLNIVREDESSSYWIWIVIGAVVLLGGGFFFYKKRQDGQKNESLRVGNE